MAVENVKDFYIRLANDESFRNQMQQVKSKDECSQLVKAFGFDFTPAEFEEYTTQLLGSVDDEGELKDLDEQELEAVFGGASSLVEKIRIQPLYGVIIWPPLECPPRPQPLYGVVLNEQA
ncbi:Nif11-like leader peptide family natural product precursor [Nostoc sp. FACHB-152]|uniref:Nif11-like leader peptide family natural product precursor n=1 Tax=unclassified Nostoc TaxID=2593658 RepID=UPI00168517AC|nr:MULTISPECIES: Nif11-like leader peptide family natural product precursor [unclassified Nostoc]MBD2451312.1 Nif11-like leader peptide family natural product precursor [Nostoc sp. FACHB-152]MBD2471262.1 Nif11-like leader peptide family natural product precursor [Nostoc sp. FACHB-145]